MEYTDGSLKLKNLIATLTLKNSYWGYLFSRVLRIPDENLPSIMGVCPEKNGTLSLRFHPKLVLETDDKNIIKILEHEGTHIINKHVPRLLRILSMELNESKKDYKSMIWNLAADCCCNTQISDFPKMIKIGGIDTRPIFPQDFKLPIGKAAEWYYESLLKDENLKCNTGNSNIDCHDNWKNADISECSDLSTMARKIEKFSGDVAKQAFKNFNKAMRGTLPSGLEELIEELLQPPKAPYYQIIQKLVKATRKCKHDVCHTRINKQRSYIISLSNMGLPGICPFPGRKKNFTFNIGILIDTSGSQGKDDIIDALSATKSIIESDRFCKTTVIENDTIVQKEYQIKRVSDIQMSVKGRGGTTLLPGLTKFRELNVDVVLGFTDGYCENLNEVKRKKLPKKIIWVVSERGSIDNINRTGFIVRI